MTDSFSIKIFNELIALLISHKANRKTWSFEFKNFCMVIRLDEILNEQKKYFLEGATLDVDFRIGKLKILKSAVINYKEKIVQAVYKDLRKK